MNVLFLTLSKIYNITDHDIYQDLIREFINHDHFVYVVTPCERQNRKHTEKIDLDRCKILRVRVGNQSNCSMIEKGISTLLITKEYKRAIDLNFNNIKFDLILYSTPPITLVPLIRSLKKTHKAATYLMLKDIFPQNAVDIGLIIPNGIIHKYFRKKEKELYSLSDYIGCMSPKNMEYLVSNNQFVMNKVRLCPNAITPREINYNKRIEQKKMRSKYGISDETCVFVYGGNLGKPQGIDYIIKCFNAIANDKRFFVFIIGNGSEYGKLKKFIDDIKPTNIKLIQYLPQEQYFNVMRCADVGMVFLDYRFTIPNFPSRILPYMENYMPIACVTDDVSDIGIIAEENEFGWKCSSNDVDSFLSMLEKVLISDRNKMGINSRLYLEKNYTTNVCYNEIISNIRS